jgi:pimeloyl-ACP methyl ester carboxylesterase
VVGNSFGASIALGLAARRPELFRTLCVHEPPLYSLATDDPEVADGRTRVNRFLASVARWDVEAACRDFIEVAMGPGTWATLTDEERAAMVASADPTAADLRDPAWDEIDLEGLRRAAVRILLTQGDQSPPFYAKIVARLADAVEAVEVKTLAGVGHWPEGTHPAEHIAVISEFAGGST